MEEAYSYFILVQDVPVGDRAGIFSVKTFSLGIVRAYSYSIPIRDVLIGDRAGRTIGMECAGRVIAVGGGLLSAHPDDLRPGDRVVVMNGGCIANQ
eukprot:1010810-Pyramimonas_sp.AAC.1